MCGIVVACVSLHYEALRLLSRPLRIEKRWYSNRFRASLLVLSCLERQELNVDKVFVEEKTEISSTSRLLPGFVISHRCLYTHVTKSILIPSGGVFGSGSCATAVHLLYFPTVPD